VSGVKWCLANIALVKGRYFVVSLSDVTLFSQGVCVIMAAGLGYRFLPIVTR
jgi:hypothetical protein